MTHELLVDGVADPEIDTFSEFIVAVVGFLYGVLLIPEGWVHLQRVRITATAAHDYLLQDSACIRVIDLATDFWTAKERYRQAMFGLLHWHIASLASVHDHERFAWQYTVLDSCWWLHCQLNGMAVNSKRHRDRLATLATHYDLAIPKAWNGGATVVDARNNLIHEAKWGGQSIGLAAAPSEWSLPSSLFWFNTRLILALLGDSSSYVRSPLRGVTVLFE